jgi:hypothetical protein
MQDPLHLPASFLLIVSSRFAKDKNMSGHRPSALRSELTIVLPQHLLVQ